VAHRLRWEAVEEVGSFVKSLCLVAIGERRLKEEATDHVGDSANHALGPTILGRGVGAREMQLNATSEEERPRGMVIKLAAIVTLQCMDGATKLGGDLGEEVSEGGKRVGLQAERKSPEKMGKIVQNQQIVFVARQIEYMGGP
jgi:hypothetical protein